MSSSALALAISTPSDRIAHSLVNDMSALVSPPDVCLKVNALLADERSSIEDFAGLVIRDTNLTARVLKLANSALYGVSGKVDTVTRAISLIGMNELAKIVYTLCAIQTFSKLSSAVSNMNSFWRHAVYCGLVAQVLAKRARVLHPERLFVAGVMHDLGTLVINQRFPEIAEATIRETEGSEALLCEAEQEWLGFTHPYIAGLMLEKWHLPESVCDAIRWHHAPQNAQIAPIEARLLEVADTIANYSGTGSFCETVARREEIDPASFDEIGIATDFTCDQVLDEVDRQFVETIYLLVA